MDFEAISQGLADSVQALPAVIGNLTVKLSAFPQIQGSIEPPTFAPTEFEMEYHQTFGATGGLVAVKFQCGLFTSLGDTDSGRKMLMAYLVPFGTSSILAALEANKTLAGTAKTLIVTRVHGAYRLYEIGATQYLGAMIEVKVWA